MKSDKEMKIVALIITIMSLFFFYTAYDSKDMISKLGFTVVGIWGIYNIFGSYIQGRISNILRRKGDDKRGDTN